MPPIEAWAWVMEEDGETGIVFFETSGGSKVPLWSMDRERADWMEPIAIKIAKMHRKPVTLMRWTAAETLRVVQP